MSRPRHQGPRALSPLELEIMTVVWNLGECTSGEVIAEYQKSRPLANTTIRTVLSNIRKKGYLDVVPSVEPRIRFRAKVTRESVARRSIKQLLSNLFQGSPREAIRILLQEENIDAKDLAEIRRLIDEYDNGGDSR